MNKNTLTGLLLMGAIILVFTYLNKPSQEELEKMQKEKQEQLAAEEKKSQPAAESIVAMSDAAKQNIASAVRTAGVLDTATHTYILRGKDVVLTLGADSAAQIQGTVTVGSQTIPAADVVNATYGPEVSAATAQDALNALNAAVDASVRYKGFSRYMAGNDSASVVLANEKVSLTIASKGGVISQGKLLDKRYNKYGGGQVCPISQGDDMYGVQLSVGDLVYDTRDYYFDLKQESDSTVVATVAPGDGVMLGFRYTLPKDSYTVRMDMIQSNMQAIIPQSKSSMDFVWNQKMTRNEAGRMFESDNSAVYFMKANGDVDNLSERSDETETVKEPLQWVAFKNQFFSTVLISNKGFDKAELTSAVLKDDPMFVKNMSMTASTEYSSQLEQPASFVFYIGPNSYPLLSDIQEEIIPEKNLKLTELIPLGWALFRWINTWIVIPVFSFLGQFISNYGIIILLLTIFIKLILFPFTYKSYMSQAKMRVLAPEIKEINEKYPGNENAMKRQQETMALYSRAGANPMSGCLPMLLQLPILIAMFRFFPSAIELRGEAFLWATDLSAPDAIIPLPFSIPMLGDKLSLFCLLMTAVNIIYTRINMQNQPGGMSSPAMKWMMYLMPVMFLVFFNNYAAGLSYYYLLSLLITIIQTYIFRRVVNEDKVRATMKANAAKPKKKSGLMARLEEAQRKQQAMLREQEKQRGKKRK